MKIIPHSVIKKSVTPSEAFQWVKDAFIHQSEYLLPPKISIKYGEGTFFNTMPCVIDKQACGVKIVSRHINRVPILSSTILLADSNTGETVALLEGDYITVLRTGAVAALAAETFAVKNYERVGFFGLGNTAYAAFDVLMRCKKNPDAELEIFLLRYKDQAEKFIRRFDYLKNVKFTISESYEHVIENSQVLFSCVSNMNGIFCDADKYPKGILVIPVHSKGFQNCDLEFDKIFADDTGHVKGFKHFAEFSAHNYAEISDVLTGKCAGRVNNDERILSYNIGVAIHDIYFAKNIYDRVKNYCDDVELESPVEKIFY